MKNLLAASMSLFAISALSLSTTARATDITASARAGTLGIGPEVDIHLPGTNFGVRGGFNTFNYGVDDIYTQDEHVSYLGVNEMVHTTYGGNFRTMNGTLTGDWYPWRSGLRISSGLVFNTGRITAQGTPYGTVSIPYVTGRTISYQTYKDAQIGGVSARGRWHPVDPYLGIGFSSRLLSSLYLSGDFGVLYQGKSQIAVRTQGPFVATPPLQKAVSTARDKAVWGMNKLPVYPVVMLGLGWRL